MKREYLLSGPFWDGLRAALLWGPVVGLPFIVAAIAAVLASGCGAGALTHHSTAAVVLGSVHSAAEGVADSAIIAEVQACAQDEACIAAAPRPRDGGGQ